MGSSPLVSLAFVFISVGCKDGRDLALGPPEKFRLALVHDGLDIGIDLEIRIPAGYESFGFSPFERHWDRRRDIGIRVTTDPERQAMLAEPCGKPQPMYGWSNTIAARMGSAENMTFVCESHRTNESRGTNELRGVRVVRLLTSVETTIQCEAHDGTHVASTKERAAQLAICGSLRVLGRSTWTRADYMEKDAKP